VRFTAAVYFQQQVYQMLTDLNKLYIALTKDTFLAYS